MMYIVKEMLDQHELLQTVSRYAILLGEGKTNAQIEKELGLTHLKAFTARKRGIESGIINIKVNPPCDKEIAKDLQSKYSLREAHVYYIGIREEVTRILGQVSAKYLERLLDDEEEEINRVAIGPGRTMSALVRSLSDRERSMITVCSTTSSTGIETHLACNVHVGIPVDKWKCPLHRFDHTMSREDKQAYLDRIDVMILGIERIPDMEGVTALALLSECKIGRLELQTELSTLAGRDMKGAAFLNYQPIDVEGSPLEWSLSEYTSVLEPTLLKLDSIKKLAEDESKRVICVAGGTDVVNAIRAGLCGGYCNVLITDYETAEELLN